MLVAINQSCVGKSTVVNDWVACHDDSIRKEKPYRAELMRCSSRLTVKGILMSFRPRIAPC